MLDQLLRNKEKRTDKITITRLKESNIVNNALLTEDSRKLPKAYNINIQ
ncbi:hypothetical protein [Aquimarina sp. RZ0]|nr:hypothetical protein [Aquimarina sp. RZ0]